MSYRGTAVPVGKGVRGKGRYAPSPGGKKMVSVAGCSQGVQGGLSAPLPKKGEEQAGAMLCQLTTGTYSLQVMV